MKKIVIICMMMILGTTIALAQVGSDDNDPNVHDYANACFEGGSMEGRCETDLDWIAGWYLIRFEAGIFTREQIPSWIIWILPPEIIPDDLTTNSTVIDTGDITACFTNGSRSFLLTGALNTISNVNNGVGTYGSTNCTGELNGGSLYDTGTITASSAGDANTKCASLGSYDVISVSQWSAKGFNVPSDWWECELERSSTSLDRKTVTPPNVVSWIKNRFKNILTIWENEQA